jgi:hypothetical protein
MIVALLVLPALIAERFTSPTQNGQYLLNPVKSYGFIVALIQESRAATLSNSGKALGKSKTMFSNSNIRTTKVELLYLGGRTSYYYARKAGGNLMILHPPKLVWEVWGRSHDRTASSEPLDVIGFLDYRSGRTLDSVESFSSECDPGLAHPDYSGHELTSSRAESPILR